MTHSVLEQIGIIAIVVSIVLSLIGAAWRMITIIDHGDSLKSFRQEITTIHVSLNNMEDKLKR